MLYMYTIVLSNICYMLLFLSEKNCNLLSDPGFFTLAFHHRDQTVPSFLIVSSFIFKFFLGVTKNSCISEHANLSFSRKELKSFNLWQVFGSKYGLINFNNFLKILENNLIHDIFVSPSLHHFSTLISLFHF